MFQYCRTRLNYFANTKIGQEALQQSQRDMKNLDKNPNRFVRYLSKQRPVDKMQVELEGRIANDLHPSFRSAMRICTGILCTPVLLGLLTGYFQPTYYLFVSFSGMAKEKYDKMWTLANPFIVAGGQLCLFLVFYDLSIYLRMPFFFHVLAPVFRKAGWIRALAKGTKTVKELSKKSNSPKAWRTLKSQAGSVK
ncbi:transmembrane protein, putative [Bodo saltans]|uniref:Transmembrane protein, putative n=1 Tax=Bodo saltans TaxID=75058 RepID=A0A0S4ISU9_BODSA|nr:transmembrane protein, putative [Bodo saltans]|eukprot:CUF60705.1 transmembrane protein, putative [Bodo saltans]